MNSSASDQSSPSPGTVPRESSVPAFGAFVRFFLRAIRPWRWAYAGILAGVLFVTAAGYVLPILQKRLINAITTREADGIWFLFCATGVLMLLVRAEAILRQRVVNSTVHKVMFRLKTRIAAAGADDVVRALPHRLDTVLTESVRNFSAGERLRFALAREILRDTRILLVDEATAHLDADNETRFLETVLRVFQTRTVLMIRHTPHPLTDGFPVLRIDAARS